jgi:acyl carrier protein
MDNKEKLRQVMADIFEVDVANINEESSQDTLEMWDSIHHMNLVFALEEVFEIQLSDEEAVQLQSFKQIRNILQENGVLF